MFKYLKKFRFQEFRFLYRFILVILAFVLSFNSSVFCYAYGETLGIHVNPQCSAILIDSLTGDVLFEKDADKLAAVASTTKIISTLVVLENCPEDELDKPFVVDPNVINEEGTSMGLQPGDIVTMRDLCHGMLLRSGNDAANAAAVKIAGSVPKFVKLMNEKAKQLGCKHTVFVTPSGLEGNVNFKKARSRLTQQDVLKLPHSTAREMAILSREAMKNKTFKEICSKKGVNLKFGNPPYKRYLKNHNKLLSQLEGCCGIKTGFTDFAGRCLVSAIERNGVNLIAVVLNDADDWVDSKNMLLYGLSKFTDVELPHNFENDTTFISLDDNEHSVKVKVKKPAHKFLTPNMIGRVKYKLREFEKWQFPPIKNGEKVGVVDYYLDNNYIAQADVVSAGEVNIDNNK